MAAFLRLLKERQPRGGKRRWLYVPYDQLSSRIGPLVREAPDEIGIVVVESTWKAERRPYHKQKLALLLANQRHFALEQAERGVAVRFVATDESFGAALRRVARELGPLRVMEPAERELRADLAPLIESALLKVVPHEGWLSTPAQFEESQPKGPPYRMDAFYRRMRQDSGILMEDGSPAGGAFSFDAENRRPWKGIPPAPEPPRFRADEVTEEVLELVEGRFGRHPGALDPAHLPATLSDARRLWRWAREECLPHFGPYEDAMSERSRSLFHTRLAPLLNLCRLTPREVLDDTLELELPLASREGFVRQVLGWREFVRHVHLVTDGFRRLSNRRAPTAGAPGDGGWSTWSGESWPGTPSAGELDGGSRTSFLSASAPLPPAFWGRTSGLRCLDRVVEEVWSTGYTHHIPRLMVLTNLATLLDVAPREICDWFWVAFADAYDWVVEPNVLGMGTFAAGELMTTKPYVCSAAYIDRMGDYCAQCRFDPKKNCPITSLYWDFLARKSEKLEGNPRMRMPMKALAKRSAELREHDARVAREVRRRLAAGQSL
jgi:deoxyribodipyrimidine photolyase-related protein